MLFFPPSIFRRYKFLLILCIILYACGVKFGVYHRVGEGETLWRISRTYGVELQEIAEINNIQDPTQIKLGEKIFIPGAGRVLKVIPLPDDIRNRRNRINLEKGRFMWPVKGRVVSRFGVRNKRKYNGIEIASRKNAKIKAAADGKIVYSGNSLRGYGNMIILMHQNNFFTIYAYNNKNLVKEGDMVKRGELIALLGRSPADSSYRLYFEIRKGKKPRNPLFFLP